jgi:hypothetical protein
MELTSPVVWFYIPVTISWVCFLIGVGSPERFIDYDWLWFLFRHISPYFWAALGVALAVGMSILGAAWSVVRILCSDRTCFDAHTASRKLEDLDLSFGRFSFAGASSSQAAAWLAQLYAFLASPPRTLSGESNGYSNCE